MAKPDDIVVVGAGPTGLTLACQLLRRGIRCRLIEQMHRPTAHSRAIGISPRSLEVFDEFGAAEGIVDAGHRIHLANFYSRGKIVGKLTTSGVSDTKFPFTLALQQYETERLLRERFAKMGGTVDSGVRLVGIEPQRAKEPVRLILENADGVESAEAHWVVGADGSRSAVREQSGIAFSDQPMNVSFSIVDAFVEGGPARGQGHYCFSPDGLLVIVPLPDGSYRFAATIDHDGEADATLDLDYLRRLVEARAPMKMNIRELRDAGWGGSRVRIQARIADTFRRGSCLLAGDAAHVFSPVGGQGMNAAIQDAQNLAWKLALVSMGRAPESLLDSYVVERLHAARASMRAANSQTRLGTINSPARRWARDILLSLATRTGLLDRIMVPALTQLAIEYPDSPLAARNSGAKRAGVGRRVANSALRRDGEDVPTTMFDVLARHPFTILALVAGAEDLTLVAELEKEVGLRYGDLVGVVPLRRQDSPSAGMASISVDSGGALARFANLRSTGVLLVRPDGHLAWRDQLDRWKSVVTFLDAILQNADAGMPQEDASPVSGRPLA
jgi:2-polyprenyl-6-methoxyphenol hydroxylase-like FAD-dependent oxidoreductase